MSWLFHAALKQFETAANRPTVRLQRRRAGCRGPKFTSRWTSSPSSRGGCFDPSLSASGRLSCAVMPGGKDMRQSVLRAIPSLRYLQAAPAFTEHFRDSDDEGDASVDTGPTRDRLPLLSPLEMASESPAMVRRSPHADGTEEKAVWVLVTAV
jgi:hypothetical protein